MKSYREHFAYWDVQVRRVADSTKWCIMSPGLWWAVRDSKMIQSIYSKIAWRCNIIFLEHPYHWINSDHPNPEKLTPTLCRDHAKEVFNWLLKTRKSVSDVFCVWSSLGFWSMNQALQDFDDNRVKLIIAKSGIVSYLQILVQLGWIEWAKKYLKVGEDGWGQLVVNPGDKPVRIHVNFILDIAQINEKNSKQKHVVHAIHGTKDIWTSHAAMKKFISNKCPPASHLFSHAWATHGFHEIPNIDETIASKTQAEMWLPPKPDNPESWWLKSS